MKVFFTSNGGAPFLPDILLDNAPAVAMSELSCGLVVPKALVNGAIANCTA